MIVGKAHYSYIISNIWRPGFRIFMVDLEHTMFPPDTDDNDLYTIFSVPYGGTIHIIIEIPTSYMQRAEELLKTYDMTLTQGKPFHGGEEFALSAEMVFTVEGHSDMTQEAETDKITKRIGGDL